ncbi:hypothetical protein ANOBCDAF_00427 [Pleomorphomonas sp. T1.2MG-36]|uniref:hypothetical protein n=1 Tax=Pleomorphomonas sp. T1.2MG-36 TaxID=3041167 RepID=UPI002477B87B|nr:hypothetical protein [Pleomorphomonas sp. T1.2MG-36]CAI9400160.1 hypothetical protein ANOBCDAF_00427 [Pleomorphomonas sp. T1.2MG-36]
MKNARASDDMVRIYVGRRASGRPVPGWEKAVLFLPGNWIGWTTITETEAKQADPDELVRCRRTPAQRWDDWLGPNMTVADDIELQAFFATVPDDEWPRLAIAVRRSQRQAAAAWHAAGARLIAAATRNRRGPASPASSLFRERGTGRRSLLKLITPDRSTSGPKPAATQKSSPTCASSLPLSSPSDSQL